MGWFLKQTPNNEATFAFSESDLASGPLVSARCRVGVRFIGAAKKPLQTLVCFGRLTYVPQSHQMFSVSKWPERILQVGPFCSAFLSVAVEQTIWTSLQAASGCRPWQTLRPSAEPRCQVSIIPWFCWNQLCLMKRCILYSLIQQHIHLLYVDDLQWTAFFWRSVFILSNHYT